MEGGEADALSCLTFSASFQQQLFSWAETLVLVSSFSHSHRTLLLDPPEIPALDAQCHPQESLGSKPGKPFVSSSYNHLTGFLAVSVSPQFFLAFSVSSFSMESL